MKIELNTMGKRLGYALDANNYKQTELAELLKGYGFSNVEGNHISKIMNGHIQTPSLDMLVVICDILGITLDWLVRGIEDQDEHNAPDVFVTDEANEIGRMVDELDLENREFVKAIVTKIHTLRSEKVELQREIVTLIRESIANMESGQRDHARLILRKIDADRN